MDNNPTLARIWVDENVVADVAGGATKVAWSGYTAGEFGYKNLDPNIFTVDIAVNNRVTVLRAGQYRVTFHGTIVEAGADVLTLFLYRNGAAIPAGSGVCQFAAGSLTQQMYLDVLVDANPNDYFELFQDVTGANNFTLTQAALTVEWIG